MIEVLFARGAGTKRIAGESLAAPHLIDVEIGHAIRRLARTGHIDRRRAEQTLEDWLTLEVWRFAHNELLGRAWELRDNVRTYDAMYIALAEMLGVPLVTIDRALASAPGVRTDIELLVV